jgi:hypothetical protein
MSPSVTWGEGGKPMSHVIFFKDFSDLFGTLVRHFFPYYDKNMLISWAHVYLKHKKLSKCFT